MKGCTAPPFLTSALDRDGQFHARAALTLGKETTIFIGYETVWDPDLIWMLWRILKPLTYAGIEPPPAVKPAAHRYTDRSIPAPHY
jgi:hypothetical protein